MNKPPFPAGHPLAPHPGLPPHPLDGVPGAFKHTAPAAAPVTPRDQEAHAQRLLREQLRRDPRMIPLNSSQGHDLPPSPPDAIGGAHLDGHSELPAFQIGTVLKIESDEPDPPLVGLHRAIKPLSNRASQQQLTQANAVAILTGFPVTSPFPPATIAFRAPYPVLVAEYEAEGSTPVSIQLETIQGPQDNKGNEQLNYAVIWQLEVGYGNIRDTRIIQEQQGRIAVTGSSFRLSAFLSFTSGTAPPPNPLPAVTALVRGWITPQIDGQLRSTTSWAGYNATFAGGTGVSLFPTACTLWRISGVNSGPNTIYLFLVDVNNAGDIVPGDATLTTPLFGMLLGAIPKNGTFSADFATSGKDFFHGMTLFPSSTLATYTLDGAAILVGNYELLLF